MKILDDILDLIFPRDIKCINCSKDIMPDTSRYCLCHKCTFDLHFCQLNTCRICGRGLARGYSDICDTCLWEGHSFSGGVCALYYEGTVKNLITKLKYKDRRSIAKYLARMIVDYDRGNRNILDKLDALISVPDHISRRRMRGFNQSEDICMEISKLIGIPCETKAVRRIKHTGRLKELNHEERRIEMQDAFVVVDAESIRKYSSIGIVDDIITTGHTLRSISDSLIDNGISQVFVILLSAKIN